MTDNRTNEQLAERLRQFAESQAMDFDNPYIAMTLNEVADRLVAAQGAAHLPTVDQIETRIKEAEHDWRNAEFVGDPDLGTLTKYVAHAIRALIGEVAGDE